MDDKNVPGQSRVGPLPDPTPADTELLQQPGLIEGVLESSPAGILVLDASGRILYVNPRAEEVLGLSRRQIIEMGYDPAQWFATHVAGQPAQPTDASFREILATGQSLRDIRTAVDLPDGRRVWLAINSAPLFNAAGKVDRVVVTIGDITAQVTAQHTLEERTHLYNMLVERVPAIVYLSALDETGTTLYISPQVERMLGFTPEEWLADPALWMKRLHPDDRPRVLGEFRRFVESREPFATEYRSVARDGRVIWLYEEAVALAPRPGERPVHQGIVVDITAHKQAEEALRQAEERYHSIVENAAVGIFRSTVEGVFLTANPAMARLFGYDSAADLITSITDIAGQTYVDPPKRHEIMQIVSHSPGMHRFECEFRRRDGRVFTGQLDMRLVRSDAGQPLHVEGFLDDITERKRLETQLRQAQKMEAVGRLAGGVAHDFNNLLTAIMGYSDLILRRLDVHDPIERDVREIRKAAEQAAALTGQMLAFSRKQVLQPRIIDLNDVIGRVDKMLQRLIGEHIALVLNLQPGLGAVKADPGQMEQVIVNLAVNARDAMPRGGQIVIRTSTTQIDRSFVSEHLGARPGKYVMLTVSDTGEGMDDETMSHLFEPFFTTKDQGRGTGLGLATIYGIVKQSDGYIWVDSEPGQGTTFAVYLPLVGASPEQSALDPRQDETRPSASETILVVEDNELVRSLISDVLEERGYKVLQASDGRQALDVYRQCQQPIHMLVSDIVMPAGMSGLDLARQIAAIDPDIRILLLSGYTEEMIGNYGTLLGQAAFLQKPFPPDLLARRVRELLDGPLQDD